MANFMGLAGADFFGAIERWIGRAIPEDFHAARALEDHRALEEGLPAVAGAIRFIESLPDTFPRAIASSSRTDWITGHLEHLGVRDAFGDKIFSGREHVERGKPEPDIYLHAAAALGVDIRRCVILEDSPVGVTGAVASGAYVIGLCAGGIVLSTERMTKILEIDRTDMVSVVEPGVILGQFQEAVEAEGLF